MNYLEYFSINSIVILLFFFIALIAIIIDKITHGASNDTFFKLRRGSPMNIMTYVRLLTYPLGHSGWAHFAGNFSFISQCKNKIWFPLSSIFKFFNQ